MFSRFTSYVNILLHFLSFSLIYIHIYLHFLFLKTESCGYHVVLPGSTLFVNKSTSSYKTSILGSHSRNSMIQWYYLIYNYLILLYIDHIWIPPVVPIMFLMCILSVLIQIHLRITVHHIRFSCLYSLLQSTKFV